MQQETEVILAPILELLGYICDRHGSIHQQIDHSFAEILKSFASKECRTTEQMLAILKHQDAVIRQVLALTQTVAAAEEQIAIYLKETGIGARDAQKSERLYALIDRLLDQVRVQPANFS